MVVMERDWEEREEEVKEGGGEEEGRVSRP